MLDQKRSLGCDETGCQNREDVIITIGEDGGPELIFENAEVDPESWKEQNGFWLCPNCYEARQHRQSVAPVTGRRKLNVPSGPAQVIPAPPAPSPYNFTPQPAPIQQVAAPVAPPQMPQAPVQARPVQVGTPVHAPQPQAQPLVINAPMHNPGAGQINMAQPTPQSAKPPLTINAPMQNPTVPTVSPQINMAQPSDDGGYAKPVPPEEMPFKFIADGVNLVKPGQ